MSMNLNVAKKTQLITETYVKFGMNSKEFADAREEYWKVFEEEAKKDNDFMGWASMESPEDCLYESICNDDDAEWVGYILKDYLRFGETISKVTGRSKWNYISEELVEEAEEYIR